MAHGKRYRQQYEKIERDRPYPPAEAISLLKQTASANFDETVELHVRSASTSVTPRSSCEAPWRFRTGSART